MDDNSYHANETIIYVRHFFTWRKLVCTTGIIFCLATRRVATFWWSTDDLFSLEDYDSTVYVNVAAKCTRR